MLKKYCRKSGCMALMSDIAKCMGVWLRDMIDNERGGSFCHCQCYRFLDYIVKLFIGNQSY